MWTSEMQWANPELVLLAAKDRRDVVEGLVPEQGVTWMYGASMSFKTFVAMSMASAVSRGADWMGLRTQACAVLYVGAEGGASLHVRRAGVEIAAGASGPLCVATERPLLDTPQGQGALREMIFGLTAGFVELTTNVTDSTKLRYIPDVDGFELGKTLLVVIDTYSQTSTGDDKTNVSAYIKALRDMIDEAAGNGQRLSFLVIDHATKAGGSYMGSVAKLNDVDSQIEVMRTGQDMLATLYQRKAKDGLESAPIAVEMVQKELGYLNGYGRPVTTLVAQDGARASRIAGLADGKAGVLLALLEDEGGRCEDDTMRRLFAAHKSNDGIKADSVAKAYKRAKETLLERGAISMRGFTLSVV